MNAVGVPPVFFLRWWVWLVAITWRRSTDVIGGETYNWRRLAPCVAASAQTALPVVCGGWKPVGCQDWPWGA